jgi:hypothetical protein
VDELKVQVEVALGPRLRLEGEHDAVSPLGETEVLSVTVPVNPPRDVTVTVEVPWPP